MKKTLNVLYALLLALVIVSLPVFATRAEALGNGNDNNPADEMKRDGIAPLVLS